MILVLFLLTVVYAVFIGVLFAAGAGAGIIVVVAVGLLLVQLFASDKLALASMGAHEVSPQEAPQLHATIERLCVQADLPKPKIAVVQTNMPNAFALGRSKSAATVCATTGILELLSPAELEGVLAHELTHVANRDVAVMTIASFFASVAAMIVQFGFLFGGGGYGGGYGGGGNNDDDSGVEIAILASIVVWIVSFLLMRTLSRYREYAADRGSAIITGRPSALSSALLKISGTMERIPTRDLRASSDQLAAFYIFPPKAKSVIGGLFATHPPLEKRIAALSRYEAQLQQGGRAAVAAYHA